MNFVVFPVGTTNIFPLANSSAGGQLLTEFNIRSRESVDTDSTVKYFIGKSFTHSMDDFAVYSQKDGYDATISNTVIQIQPGRAIVNGHYVELLTPINVDMTDANALAAKEGVAPLKGKLAVGLKMAYSTYETLAGSALIENESDYYEGVQVVILPQSDVKLPADVPGDNEFTKVNMHLLLATFNFRNGAVSGVKQNANKIKTVDAERILNIERMLSGTFVSKAGLDPNKLYIFAGKSSDGTQIDGRDTWCDATDSAMIWDSNPDISSKPPSVSQAEFTWNDEGEAVLKMPHKQVDGMVNREGVRQYYQDKMIPLPKADYMAGTSGVVTESYTNRIKEIGEKVNLIYRLPNGRMRQYIPILTNRDDLPAIPVSRDTKWPYSYSEYSLDISQLEATVAKVSSQLQDLKNSINDIIDSRINATVPGVINNNLGDIKTSIGNVQSLASSIDKWLAKYFGGDPDKPYPGSPDTDTLSKLCQAVYGFASPNDNPAQGSLLYEVNRLETNWDEYINTESDKILIRITTAIETMDNAFTELVADFNEEKVSLRNYVDARVQEALDSRSIFTTWTWQPGDYVLVGEDRTVNSNIAGRYPSTMYVVGPSTVTNIRYLEGQDITTKISTTAGVDSPTYLKNYQTMLRTVPQQLAGGIELASYNLTAEGQGGSAGTGLWDVSQYKGAIDIDYFVARLKTTGSTEVEGTTQTWEEWTCYFYTPSQTEGRYSYLDPVWITGGVPLATETSVGGFVNVPNGYYGNGYVRLNDDGYLQLVDYQLLLTGIRATQLGQDYSEGAGLALSELQSILEENVNDRICFPNAAQIEAANENGTDPNVIHLYLDLPEDVDGDTNTLVIHDISSRYQSCLYVHINGSATDLTTIIFKNCDRLRIDSSIGGSPNIILDNVCLYYDAEVIQRCLTNSGNTATPITNMSLWYKKFDPADADLQVDGMTVELIGNIETTDGIDPWDSTYANDNHYSYALRSLTFADDGSIINVGMLVGDSTTANIDEGKSVFVADFTLPQSVGLNYPTASMTHRIKVSGSFVSSYYLATDEAYMMKQTEFSALTHTYDPVTQSESGKGTVAFYTDAEVVSHVNGVNPGDRIDCWDLNTSHYFVGGVID